MLFPYPAAGFHEGGTCGTDRSEQKDAVYHHPNAGVPSLTFLLTIGKIVVNVAKSYTYDVQLEIKSGALDPDPLRIVL